MCTENQVNNIVGQISQFYRSVYGDKIVAIYLYGSYARGNYTEESDIDITAIVRGDRMDLQEKLKQIWDISADIKLENDVDVSPVVIPYAEYEAYKEILPYYMNIQKEGKQIVNTYFPKSFDWKAVSMLARLFTLSIKRHFQ